jgi:hypothetical protein
MDPHQKEELRRLSLRWMAERSALAFNARSVHAGVSREFPCTHTETEETLEFLKSSKLLDDVPNSMGGTRYYKINAAGQLAHERGI